MIEVKNTRPPVGFTVQYYVSWEPEPWLEAVFEEILSTHRITNVGVVEMVEQHTGRKISRRTAGNIIRNAEKWEACGRKWPEPVNRDGVTMRSGPLYASKIDERLQAPLGDDLDFGLDD